MYALAYFISCRVSQTWKQGREFTTNRCAGMVFEDDNVESTGGCDL